MSTSSPTNPRQTSPREKPTASQSRPPDEARQPQPQSDQETSTAACDPADDSSMTEGVPEADAGRDREQTALAVLLLISLSFLGWRYYQLVTRQPRTFAIEKASDEIGYRIDINSATWFELSQLEAIGPVLAKRIVADRDENGPFQSIDDLQRVSGIGPRTVARNRRWMKATATPSD